MDAPRELRDAIRDAVDDVGVRAAALTALPRGTDPVTYAKASDDFLGALVEAMKFALVPGLYMAQSLAQKGKRDASIVISIGDEELGTWKWSVEPAPPAKGAGG